MQPTLSLHNLYLNILTMHILSWISVYCQKQYFHNIFLTSLVWHSVMDLVSTLFYRQTGTWSRTLLDIIILPWLKKADFFAGFCEHYWFLHFLVWMVPPISHSSSRRRVSFTNSSGCVPSLQQVWAKRILSWRRFLMTTFKNRKSNQKSLVKLFRYFSLFKAQKN